MPEAQPVNCTLKLVGVEVRSKPSLDENFIGMLIFLLEAAPVSELEPQEFSIKSKPRLASKLVFKNDGLHGALEAKEHVPVQQETQTLATITFQNYFRLYEVLSG